MRLLVSGASGLVGAALVRESAAAGDSVVTLGRGGQSDGAPPAGIEEVRAWDPFAAELDDSALRGVDAVIHLAGESIASGRWTEEKKRRILESRENGTRILAEALARAAGGGSGPSVLVSASAVGYYGDRGDELLTEDSAPGEGFLPDVCRAWEAATEPAESAGVRVVHVRIGVVLSAAGGALHKMRSVFKMGVGGKLGSGKQYMSFITRGDLVRLLRFAITAESLRGAANATAPNPVTNRDFTKALGKALHRPSFLPLPAFAARLAMGEMAEALLFESQRVLPQAATAAGFTFEHPTLETALPEALGDEAL